MPRRGGQLSFSQLPCPRRRSVGVIPGDWILDNLAIDFERFLIADTMPPKQQAKDLRNCLNAFRAPLLYFRKDVGYLLGPPSHIVSILKELHVDFCRNSHIGRSAGNISPPRFLPLIMAIYRLTTSLTVAPVGCPAVATMSGLPNLYLPTPGCIRHPQSELGDGEIAEQAGWNVPTVCVPSPQSRIEAPVNIIPFHT